LEVVEISLLKSIAYIHATGPFLSSALDQAAGMVPALVERGIEKLRGMSVGAPVAKQKKRPCQRSRQGLFSLIVPAAESASDL